MQIGITLRDKPVGTNYDKSIFYVDVTPGRQDFIFTNPSLISLGSGKIQLDTVAGQTYYIEMYVPGVGLTLSSGAFVSLPGATPIDDGGNAMSHCSQDICAHVVSAGAAQTAIGPLIFEP